MFDEPELHLHPELTNRLLQALRTVGERNQFILSTHSPDLISASLDDSVVFVAPPKGDQSNQAIAVSEDDETNQALRLLGQSIGIIALGRKIVLIEGTHSSLDKQTYGAILRDKFRDLVLVPSGGKGVLASFSSIVDSVLSKSLWGVEFFMLCDRDAVPFASTARIEGASSGKLRTLKRYHLENYYLDEGTWSRAFADMEGPNSWLRDPVKIRAAWREIARDMVPYAAALTVSASLRQAFGNFDLMPKAIQGVAPDELKSLIMEKRRVELERAQLTLDDKAIADQIETIVSRLTKSLEQDTDVWKREIPGRPLLQQFAARAKEDVGRMKLMYLNESARQDFEAFKEVLEIFDSFAIYT